MARRRFYAPPEDFVDSIVWLSREETNHLIRVLRATPGEEAFVFDGCGQEHRCKFRTVQNDRAQLDVLDAVEEVVESPIQLEIAQGLAKGEKFDFIVQKATELGVTSIAPIVTRYSEIKLADLHATKRVERWRRISLEALKQCGRRMLVDISEPTTFEAYLQALRSDSDGSGALVKSTCFVFNERGGIALDEALGQISDSSRITAMIGPEGGWSIEEIDFAEKAGCISISLGRRVLRTETAAVVALALIQNALGDLKGK
jgi:16S rRNA (uracil1498-N3)-methyltransferase